MVQKLQCLTSVLGVLRTICCVHVCKQSSTFVAEDRTETGKVGRRNISAGAGAGNFAPSNMFLRSVPIYPCRSISSNGILTRATPPHHGASEIADASYVGGGSPSWTTYHYHQQQSFPPHHRTRSVLQPTPDAGRRPRPRRLFPNEFSYFNLSASNTSDSAIADKTALCKSACTPLRTAELPPPPPPLSHLCSANLNESERPNQPAHTTTLFLISTEAYPNPTITTTQPLLPPPRHYCPPSSSRPRQRPAPQDACRRIHRAWGRAGECAPTSLTPLLLANRCASVASVATSRSASTSLWRLFATAYPTSTASTPSVNIDMAENRSTTRNSLQAVVMVMEGNGQSISFMISKTTTTMMLVMMIGCACCTWTTTTLEEGSSNKWKMWLLHSLTMLLTPKHPLQSGNL